MNIIPVQFELNVWYKPSFIIMKYLSNSKPFNGYIDRKDSRRLVKNKQIFYFILLVKKVDHKTKK